MTIAFSFDKKFVDRYTGIEIDNGTIVKTLASLGFGISEQNDVFDVTVPSWRSTKDVTMKADIIEEITRIYGYDNFDVHTAVSPLYPVRIESEKNVEDQIKDLLVKRYSLHELHSYIWTYNDEYKALGIEVEDNVKIVNATNPNIEIIRRSILPTQLCQVKYNTAYAPSFGVFEIGRVADGVDEITGLCNERKMLCVTLFDKTASPEQLYLSLRDMLATMADDIKHESLTFEKLEAVHSYQHPRNLNAVICAGRKIGEIGLVHPTVAKKIDKKASMVYAELDVAAFAEIPAKEIVYEEPSKYPEMEVDLTFRTERFAPLGEAVAAIGSKLVKKVSVADTYTDEQGKSISIRLLFSDKSKTLTREEVSAVTDALIEKLKQNGISLKQ